MTNKFNIITTFFQDLFVFISLQLNVRKSDGKALLVNVDNPQLYHRFFYLLLKFYQISGYNIYYPMGFSMFRNLRNKDKYLGLIAHEKNFMSINLKGLPKNYITLNDSMFSNDYFDNYFNKDNNDDKNFHIPMSFHPYMYHHNIWNLAVETNKNRHNCIFCYGNFDAKAYLDIERTEFKVIPRTVLLSFFQKKTQFIAIKNKEEVIFADRQKMNEQFVFAIKENYSIKMEDVRELLSFFNFYLCCPGVVMPLCHNVIEAMSVGTIPLIEREYAEVMYPNLEHKINAILFDDLNDLDQILDTQIFKFSKNEIAEMRKNVLNYYEEFLSPEGVVHNVNESIKNKNLIYLQAEHRSVKFVKQKQ